VKHVQDFVGAPGRLDSYPGVGVVQMKAARRDALGKPVELKRRSGDDVRVVEALRRDPNVREASLDGDRWSIVLAYTESDVDVGPRG
jgi:hypothetical protein